MTPETVTPLKPRPRADVADMATVAQANMAQLQTARHKRFGAPRPTVASPGAVRRFREALIDWRDLKNYAEPELLLLAHQVWGQHCLFCWTFFGADPHHPPAFAGLTADAPMRCPGEIGSKLLDIERGLWRLLHEDRLRHHRELRGTPEFLRETQAANDIPMLVFGQNVRVCSDADLLACTCEYAGMLAAIRWIADDRWTWNQPGIMELDATPAG